MMCFIIVCFVLQTTLFRSLSFGNVGPNLLIITTSAFGFMRGRKTGTLIGFISGLLVDIFFGEVLGFYALLYMYIGFLNGLFRKIFYPENIKLPLILITGSDLAFNLVIYVLLFALRGKFQFDYYFLHIILPEIVYTIVITLGLYPLMLFLNTKIEKFEKRSKSKFV